MFAVVVQFQLKPGAMQDFLPLMIENARTSKTAEPECHQFDVVTDTDTPDVVFLYELYTDAAAFQAHLKTDHFLRFDAEVADMIADKDVQTFDTVAR